MNAHKSDANIGSFRREIKNKMKILELKNNNQNRKKPTHWKGSITEWGRQRRIGELEDRSLEMRQSEQQKKKTN